MKEAHRRKRHRQKLSKRDILLAPRRRWVASLPPIELTYTETFGPGLKEYTRAVLAWLNSK